MLTSRPLTAWPIFRDVYHVMALFCLVLNLLGERTSKASSVDSAVSDVIGPKGL